MNLFTLHTNPEELAAYNKPYMTTNSEYGRDEWYMNGERHREAGPAVDHVNGDKFWYLNGMLHREGGPAVSRVKGLEEWRFEGKLHRIDGPAKTGYGGGKRYFINGKEVAPFEGTYKP